MFSFFLSPQPAQNCSDRHLRRETAFLISLLSLLAVSTLTPTNCAQPLCWTFSPACCWNGKFKTLSHNYYWFSCGPFPLEVNHHLLGHIAESMVSPTPHNKVVYQMPVLLFLSIPDASHNHRVDGIEFLQVTVIWFVLEVNGIQVEEE